jgi:23S rRNA pseudouridine2605 synthase
MKQRLSKVLAACGVASRRKCEELIFEGKVTVNGEKILIPQTIVDSDQDKIIVEGQKVKLQDRKVYYALNKPAGLICTSKEAGGINSVLSLFDDSLRLFTVGRLDKDTTGLILVTNDGHFSNAVIHPSKNISKEYLAKTDKDITDQHLKALDSGGLVEGTWVKPLKVTKVRNTTLKMAVSEGKKREVRRLLEYVGLEVLELRRIRIGSMVLGALKEGEYRELSDAEKEQLLNS